MPWGKDKTTLSKPVKEAKIFARLIIEELKKRYDISDTAMIKFEMYNALRRYAKQNLQPNEVLVGLKDNPTLFELVYRRKWYDLMQAIKKVTKQEFRDIVMATVFYNNYFDTGSLFKSILRTKHYHFYKFSRQELMNLFKTYPFLKEKEHLTHVVDLIKIVEFPSILTKNGLAPKYEVI